MLQRYRPNDSHVIHWDSVELNQDLTFEKEPIAIGQVDKDVEVQEYWSSESSVEASSD